MFIAICHSYCFFPVQFMPKLQHIICFVISFPCWCWNIRCIFFFCSNSRWITRISMKVSFKSKQRRKQAWIIMHRLDSGTRYLSIQKTWRYLFTFFCVISTPITWFARYIASQDRHLLKNTCNRQFHSSIRNLICLLYLSSVDRDTHVIVNLWLFVVQKLIEQLNSFYGGWSISRGSKHNLI